MSQSWNYYNPVHIQFGRNSRQFLVDVLSDKRCLIVTSERGRRQMNDDTILYELATNSDNQWVDTILPNPAVSEMQTQLNRLKSCSFDAIIGFGGGSVIDSAKVFSVVLANGLKDTLLSEFIIGTRKFETVTPIKMYAVPTTAGTGSEVTPFATVWDHNLHKKYSFSSRVVFPHMAVVDPVLSESLPKKITISTGLDAINQAAESIWNRNMTPVSEEIATQALKLGFKNLPVLLERPNDQSAKTAMAAASLLAGMSISQTRTALCHSMSYPMTTYFKVPHGLACAFTMPAVFKLNMRVDDGRFKKLAAAIGVTDLQRTIENLNTKCEVNEQVKCFIPSYKELHNLIKEMHSPERANNNLANVDFEVIENIIKSSWGII